MKAMYLRTYDTTDDDNMTNAEYITYTAEPKYTLIVALTKVLTGDVLRCVLEYTDQSITDADISARTHRRLYASIMDGNFEEFKFIYDNEYMVSGVFGWFEFCEEWYDSVWNFYPMCECWCTDYQCKSCNPVKVYRDLYIQHCGCENGKRYLAFRMIYDEAYEFITVCDKDKDNKHKKKKQQQETNPSQQIADYIIASGPIILDHSLILNR